MAFARRADRRRGHSILVGVVGPVGFDGKTYRVGQCPRCGRIFWGVKGGKGSHVTDYPSSDESFALLHAAGCPVGELPLLTDDGRAWLVTGANGENVIEARAATEAEA
jgi:hypothetical protein